MGLNKLQWEINILFDNYVGATLQVTYDVGTIDRFES